MPRHTADVPPPSYACGCDRDKERENLPLCIARVRSVPLTLSLLRWNSPSPFRPALFHRFPVLPLRPCLGLDSRGRRRGHFISQPPPRYLQFYPSPLSDTILAGPLHLPSRYCASPCAVAAADQTGPRQTERHTRTHPPTRPLTHARALVTV